jgi:hypothetical protein
MRRLAREEQPIVDRTTKNCAGSGVAGQRVTVGAADMIGAADPAIGRSLARIPLPSSAASSSIANAKAPASPSRSSIAAPAPPKKPSTSGRPKGIR